jgi:hypothetical protein
LPDHLLDLQGKAIEPGAQIDRTTGEEHLRPWRQAAHAEPFIARGTCDSAFSSTRASTLTRAPFGSTTSIPPRLTYDFATGKTDGRALVEYVRRRATAG